jgi:hypothetical protein
MAKARGVFESLTLATGSVSNEQVASNASIDADKLQHIYKAGTHFDLAIGGTVASREEIVFVASTTGTIRAFHCTMNVGGTTGDSDFDLLVNGVSVLSAAVNFANGDADKLVKDGTISDAPLALDDIVSISVTRNSAHDGTGPFAWVEIEETAA